MTTHLKLHPQSKSLFVLRILFFSLSCFFVGCDTPPPRLQESGKNAVFSFSMETPFAEYVRKTRKVIEKNRRDITRHNKEKVLDANSPFELKPDEQKCSQPGNGKWEKGILLIHGLSDSPYFTKPIARHFQSNCFLVRSILLPGHGTVPGALLRSDYREWVKAVEYGTHRLKLSVEKLYVGGFSTGGALSVHQALKDPELRGLILLAPALGLKSPFAGFAQHLRFFKAWFVVHADKDFAKYESFPMNSIAQIHALAQETDRLLEEGKRLSMPVFCVATMEDGTVDSRKTVDVFRKFATSDKSRMVLFGKDTKRAGEGGDGRMIPKKSSDPEGKILDYSHVSIPFPPDDPHYGRKGEYKNCLHYVDEEEKRRECLEDSEIWQGETNPENMQKHTMRRLTYNPRYSDMTEALDNFLAGVDVD